MNKFIKMSLLMILMGTSSHLFAQANFTIGDPYFVRNLSEIAEGSGYEAFKIFTNYVMKNMDFSSYVQLEKPSNKEVDLVRTVISKTESLFRGSIDTYDVFGNMSTDGVRIYYIWIMQNPESKYYYSIFLITR